MDGDGELKYTIGLTNFHAKKVEYIHQEIFARLIIYNFCGRFHGSCFPMPGIFPRPNTSTEFRSIHSKECSSCERRAKGSAKSPSQLSSKLPIQDIIENAKKMAESRSYCSQPFKISHRSLLQCH